MTQIIPTGQYMRVVQPIVHTASGKRATVNYGARWSFGETPQGAVNRLDQIFRAIWRPFVDTEANFEPAQGYYRPDADTLALVTSNQGVQAGTSNVASVPSNVARIFRLRTALVGRTYRGRIYLPWAVNESLVSEVGVLSTPAVTAGNIAVNSWINNVINDADLDGLFLLHSPPKGGGPAPAPTLITSGVSAPVVGTQRRRLG